jgi:hypothetical protein
LSKLKQSNVLRYEKGRKSQTTVRRHFIQWRSEQSPPIPLRCDNPECVFHTQDLIWNGDTLKLVLDHKNGVNGDNRPKNLQFLCPNCNSQQSMHGGSNKGRVIQSSGGFAHVAPDGKKHYTLPAKSGEFNLTGNDVTLKKN